MGWKEGHNVAAVGVLLTPHLFRACKLLEIRVPLPAPAMLSCLGPACADPMLRWPTVVDGCQHSYTAQHSSGAHCRHGAVWGVGRGSGAQLPLSLIAALLPFACNKPAQGQLQSQPPAHDIQTCLCGIAVLTPTTSSRLPWLAAFLLNQEEG